MHRVVAAIQLELVGALAVLRLLKLAFLQELREEVVQEGGAQ